MAAAGVNEKIAKRSGITYICGEFHGIDRHPGHFMDASRLSVKLYVSPTDGGIIGGEIWGGRSAGELINIVGMAIQKRINIFELISYQIGTHPLLTGPPTNYALIKAAEDTIQRMRKQTAEIAVPGQKKKAV